MRSVETPSETAFQGLVGLSLARLGEAASALYRESFKDTGLKPPHVATLNVLRMDAVSQQALSETTGIDPVKLVGILNDLEAAALVERRRDPIDRRRHNVAITAAGRAQIAEIERLAGIVEERIFAGLSQRQRAALADLLDLVSQTSPIGRTCPDAAAADAGACADGSSPGCESG